MQYADYLKNSLAKFNPKNSNFSTKNNFLKNTNFPEFYNTNFNYENINDKNSENNNSKEEEREKNKTNKSKKFEIFLDAKEKAKKNFMKKINYHENNNKEERFSNDSKVNFKYLLIFPILIFLFFLILNFQKVKNF